MLEGKRIELEALRQRSNDISYLMIEAEGEEYFSYATELELLEYDIDCRERELTEITEIFQNEGIV